MPYFTAQWFYRAEDTVWVDNYYFYSLYVPVRFLNHVVSSFGQIIQKCYDLIDQKRVFFSEVRNDNPLDCLVKKLRITRLPPNVC